MITDLKTIKQSCTACGGSGFILKPNGEDFILEDCTCLLEITRQIQLTKANIPKQYWDFSIDNMDGDFPTNNSTSMNTVREFIENLPQKLEGGHGLWFNSPPGLGKSTCICSILIAAIGCGYKAYYTKSFWAVQKRWAALKDTRAAYDVDAMLRSDILAVEEMEKIYLSESDDSLNNKMFFDFLMDTYDSKKSLLVSSNIPIDMVLKKFPTYIGDRLRLLTEVKFKGETARKRQKKKGTR